MNRKDFQNLSRTRIEEAKALLKLRHHSGAYYLAGYAVECALKACIAKTTRRYDFPDKEKVAESYQHSPKKLLKAANLERLLQSSASSDPILSANWTVVEAWSESSRYRVYAKDDADSMIEAVGNDTHGVLPWIQHHW